MEISRKILFIAYTIDGSVVGVYGSEKEAEPIKEVMQCSVMPCTEKAAMLAEKLGNITYSKGLSFFSIKGHPVLMLREEREAFREGKWLEAETLESRLIALASRWDECIALLEKCTPEEIAEVVPDVIDRAVIHYAVNTAPSWRIHSLTPECAALIANARLAIDAVAESSTPLYLKCSDPSRALVRNIAEIIYIPYDENGEYDGRLTLSAFLVSDARFALSFPLNKANEALLMRREEEENLAVNDGQAMELYRVARSFVSSFTALMDCEKSPIEIEDTERRKKEKLLKKGLRPSGGITRYSVSLTKRYRGIIRDPYQKSAAIDKGDESKDFREGKSLSVVSVSGFIRNQAYGPGRTLRKRIWVDGFIRGQWIRNGVTFVTVNE